MLRHRLLHGVIAQIKCRIPLHIIPAITISNSACLSTQIELKHSSATTATATILHPNIQKLQDKTISLVKTPLGQWTKYELSTANTLLNQWLALEQQSRHTTSRATQIYRRWLLELDDGNPIVRNTDFVSLLYRVLFASIAVKHDQNYKNAKRLIETLERLSEKLGDTFLMPGDKAYSMLLQILAQTHGTEPETCYRAEKLLEQRLRTAGDQGCDLMLWNSVLAVLADNSPYNSEAADKAEWILKTMPVEPNEVSFSTVLNSLAKSKSRHAAYRAHTILETMVENKSIKVTNWSFNIVIRALSTLASPDAAKAAEQLLWKLVQLTQEGRLDCEPDSYTFSAVITCWAKSGSPDGPERAEYILRRITQLADEFGWSVQLNRHAYLPVIDAWANSGLPNAVYRAERLLHEMEVAYTDGNKLLTPDEFAYTTVIKALARSREEGAGERAEKILIRMEELTSRGANHLQLNSISYSATIHAYAKSAEAGSADRALAVLRRMQRLHEEGNEKVIPTTNAYNATIAAFGKIGDADTALLLFNEMIEQTKMGMAEATPSQSTYSSVLNALAKSKVPSSVAKAMDILELLEARFEAGDKESCPNNVVYTAAINCLKNSTDLGKADKAEALLKKTQRLYEQGQEDCKPSVHIVGAVLNTFMSCPSSVSEDMTARARAIIDWAEKEGQRGNIEIRPNRICYNSLLGVWANSGKQNALEEMMSIVRMLKSHPDPQMTPDVVTYNWIMTALIVAKSPDAAIQCHRILRNMISVGDIWPNRACFHSVLEACMLLNQADESKMLILRHMVGLITTANHWKPSSDTFALFFRALATVEGRPDMVVAQKMMHHCTTLTLVDSTVQEAFDQLVSMTHTHSTSRD